MKASSVLVGALAVGGAWWLWKRNADAKLLAPVAVPPGMLPSPAPRVRKKCRSGSIAIT